MRIGFIGLGTMGGPMATHLQDAGYDLVVNDIQTDAANAHLAAGAEWAPSPAAVMAQAEVVFTSLPMPRDVEEVALGPSGLIESLAPGKVYFDLSTNSLSVVRKIHSVFASHGAQVLDSPISGGQAGAKSGKLAFYVGGDEKVFDAHRNLLAAMGDQPIYVGEIGSGTVAKLVHNLGSQAISVVVGEVFTMGVRAGVDPLVLWKAIRQGAAGRRRSFDQLRFLAASFDDPSFRLGLAHKDVALATALGRELNVPMRLSNLVLEELTEAMARGWGDRDSSALLQLQEERSGAHVAISQHEIDAEMDRG